MTASDAKPRRLIAASALALLAGCAQQDETPAIDEAAVIAAAMPIAQGFQAELQAQLKAAITQAVELQHREARVIEHAAHHAVLALSDDHAHLIPLDPL